MTSKSPIDTGLKSPHIGRFVTKYPNIPIVGLFHVLRRENIGLRYVTVDRDKFPISDPYPEYVLNMPQKTHIKPLKFITLEVTEKMKEAIEADLCQSCSGEWWVGENVYKTPVDCVPSKGQFIYYSDLTDEDLDMGTSVESHVEIRGQPLLSPLVFHKILDTKSLILFTEEESPRKYGKCQIVHEIASMDDVIRQLKFIEKTVDRYPLYAYWNTDSDHDEKGKKVATAFLLPEPVLKTLLTPGKFQELFDLDQKVLDLHSTNYFYVENTPDFSLKIPALVELDNPTYGSVKISSLRPTHE